MPAITVGQGLKDPQGTRREVAGVRGLAELLAGLDGVEVWWSQHVWTEDRRDGARWESASIVALDLDTKGHVPLGEEQRTLLEAIAKQSKLPGNIFHLTPAGARIVFVLGSTCTSREDYAAVAQGCAALVAAQLAKLELSWLSVDPKVHLDVGRLYFVPNCTAKGARREAMVVVMAEDLCDAGFLAEGAKALAAAALAPVAPLRRAVPSTPAVDRARAYLEKMGPSVEGQHGDDHAFRVAAVAVNDFDLSESEAWGLLCEWNQGCAPPWPERDLRRFLVSAARNAKRPRGAKLLEERPRSATPAPSTTTPPPAPTKLSTRFRWFTADRLREPPPKQEFILFPYIPARTVTTLAGTGGVSKTTLLTGLAVTRALGLPFFGRTTPRRGKTVILSTEDGQDDYHRKLAALRHELGEAFDEEAVAKNVGLIDLPGEPVRLVEMDKARGYVPSPFADELAATLLEEAPGVDLVVMETVSRLAGGIETNESLSVLVEACQRVCRAAGVAIVLVSHVSQEAGRKGYADAYAPRGGTALGDNGRSTMVLTRLNEENREALLPGAEVGPSEMERLLVLTHPKSNGAPSAKNLVLERATTPHGPVLRQAFIRTRDIAADQKRLRLCSLVAELHRRGGMVVTRTTVRDQYARLLGCTQAEVGELIGAALFDGDLVERTLPHGGRAKLLVPTRDYPPFEVDEQNPKTQSGEGPPHCPPLPDCGGNHA